MGGPGSGGHNRKPPGMKLGNVSTAARNAASIAAANAATPKPGTKHKLVIGVPQPNASVAWDTRVCAWWRALGKSDLALVAQPIDWMNAWIAADVLQVMYDNGFTAGMLQVWHSMADRLHAPDFSTLEEIDTPPAPEAKPDAVERMAQVQRLFAVGED